MTQSLPQYIAREVRAEMARQRVTQRQMAEWLDISQPQVASRLNGDIEFRPSELEKIAEAMDVPVTLFLPAPARAA